MPNVNLIELEDCLDTLLPYLEKNHRKDYAAESVDRVRDTIELFHKALAHTDETYHEWRVERAEGKLAFKALHRSYTSLQKRLEDEGAFGYPDYPVEYYLDEGKTLAACREMRDFLILHRQSIEFADDEIEKLSGLLNGALQENREADEALVGYRRVANARKAAMERAIEVIGDLRRKVRGDLGRTHPDYLAIKWPAMVSPDPM